MLGSNPGQLRLRHWLSDALATRLHLILKIFNHQNPGWIWIHLKWNETGSTTLTKNWFVCLTYIYRRLWTRANWFRRWIKSTTVSYVNPGLRIRIHFIRIRIQHFRLNTDPDPDPILIRIKSGSRAVMTKNGEQLQLKKKIKFFFIKLQFTYP
jgi:hypothetical protein